MSDTDTDTDTSTDTGTDTSTATDDPAAAANADPCIVDTCAAKRPGRGGGPGGACAGQGMGQPSQVNSFAQGMASLQKSWSGLSPTQRMAGLQNLVSNEAANNNFPAPALVTKAGADDGQMSARTWTISVNPDLVQNDLTPDAAKNLGDTVFHETRHAEQWYLMARDQAAQGQTASQIAASTHIPSPIATAATRDPLEPDSPRKACADAITQSVIGSGQDHRIETLTNLDPQEQALKDARAKFDKSIADFHANLPTMNSAQMAQGQAAYNADYAAIGVAQHTYDATYAAYRALPEEADAWAVGSKAGNAIAALLGGH